MVDDRNTRPDVTVDLHVRSRTDGETIDTVADRLNVLEGADGDRPEGEK